MKSSTVYLFFAYVDLVLVGTLVIAEIIELAYCKTLIDL